MNTLTKKEKLLHRQLFRPSEYLEGHEDLVSRLAMGKIAFFYGL